MKKFRSFLMIAAVSLLTVACVDDVAKVRTLNSINVGEPEFCMDGSKVHLTFSTSGFSKLSYDDLDMIAVNGTEYTLHEHTPYWTATTEGEPVTASTFYCFYGHEAHLSGYQDGTMYFNLSNTFTNNVSSSNGVLLAGSTESDIVTLHPACCIIRFVGSGISNVKVGFEDERVPKKGIISAVDGKIISAEAYFKGVTQNGDGQFLQMVEGDGDCYVAIPIKGDQISTTLYFEWEKNVNGNSTTIKRKTSGRVTLNRGFIYSIGEGAVSPWDENGASLNTFQVARRSYVFFSAANLQCQPYDIINGLRTYNIFKLADKQYRVIGTPNEDISPTLRSFIDLMGWGTSGWESGAWEYDPSASDPDNWSYWPGDDGTNNDFEHNLTDECANADWGVFNRGHIYYGSNSNTGDWRTLTADEWDYLLNGRRKANTKWALGTIATVHGLIILPDDWNLPDGLTFTAGSASGYSTNTYSLDTWDKMEKAGAVFLPAGGYRQDAEEGSVNQVNTEGYYWSTTYSDEESAKALIITSSGVEVDDAPRARGCNVRLVKDF